MSAHNKILIILTGSLGDIARATVIPTAIKNSWPNCHITWLVDSLWVDYLRLNSSIDNFIIFDRNTPVLSFLKIFSSIHREKFDICLDLQRILKSGMLSWASFSAHRIGFHPKNSKELNYFFNNKFIKESNEKEVSKLEQYIDFLEFVKVPRPTVLDFGILKNAIKVDLSEHKATNWQNPIAVVLSSSWQSKNWNITGYTELIEKLLAATNSSILLIGSKADMPQAVNITQQLANDRIMNLCGATSLTQLAATLSHCTLCIGPDSGPGHIAAALGVKVITLFGPTLPARVAPYKNEQHVVKVNVPCGPCLKRKCPGFGNICMKSITSEMVLNRALAVLQH